MYLTADLYTGKVDCAVVFDRQRGDLLGQAGSLLWCVHTTPARSAHTRVIHLIAPQQSIMAATHTSITGMAKSKVGRRGGTTKCEGAHAAASSNSHAPPLPMQTCFKVDVGKRYIGQLGIHLLHGKGRGGG